MTTEPPNTHLAITAIGADKTSLVERLAGKIAECGCNIEESRMAQLGQQCAMVMLVAGPWNALSRLEGQLEPLAGQLGLTIHHQRTRKRERTQAAMPYRVDVVAPDQPGIVHNLAMFFARHGIAIEEMQTDTYPAPHTGAAMCAIMLVVGIPASLHLPTLRGDFLDYCDDLNLDAIFEPVRR